MTLADRAAANVRLLRNRRGWTQGELAERAGLTENRVWALEGGKRRITVDDVEAFASALEVTPARLLSDEPEPTPDPLYEVTVEGGVTQDVAADTITPDELMTVFYLRGVSAFLAPTARILGIRLISQEATNA
ncbi:helix-turn-helix domain-containing protein [Streptomyces parvus]|uniref:helix-turn-helix domain-containing protein n=1 Tax=Streptomyces parvus TaxID=66428 RepID=UPI0033265FF2